MNMPVYKVTGAARVSDLIKCEFDPAYCRESYTLKAGSGTERKVILGTLLAVVFAASALNVTSAADAGNTGDGTLTLADPAHTSAVKDGDYTVVCTTGGADGTSKFRVEDPAGKQVGTATGGTAFNKQIKFTIAGGAAAFVEGDKFVVSAAVDYGDPANEKIEWDPAASDGSERIWGIALGALTAPDGTNAEGGLAMRRGPAILFIGQIQWPAGITDDQKEQAVNALEEMGIIVRA